MKADQLLTEWAVEVGVTPAYATRLAKQGRILHGADLKPSAEKRGRDWFVVKGSHYEYKSMGGFRKGGGRPKA